MAYDIGKPVPKRKLYNVPPLEEEELDPFAPTGPNLNGAVNAFPDNWIGKTPVPAPAPPGKQPGFLSRLFTKENMNNFYTKGTSVANAMAPFMSNIVNSFRKPPKPVPGQSFAYSPLQRVNFSDEKEKISSVYQAANKSAERTVDGNTAEAIKAFNRGEEISKLSAVNEKETNVNIGISNQQAGMDQQTSNMNTALRNKYNDELVERGIAKQRESSANWANAGDKLMMIKNEKSKEATELAKARVLATGLYGKSGVLDRSRKRMKEKGEPDPLGMNYSDLEESKEKDKKALGGIVRGLPARKVI